MLLHNEIITYVYNIPGTYSSILDVLMSSIRLCWTVQWNLRKEAINLVKRRRSASWNLYADVSPLFLETSIIKASSTRTTDLENLFFSRCEDLGCSSPLLHCPLSNPTSVMQICFHISRQTGPFGLSLDDYATFFLALVRKILLFSLKMKNSVT